MTSIAAVTGRVGIARWWTELVADLADHVPGGMGGLAALVIVGAGAVAGLLYWWPHRRLPRRPGRHRSAAPVDDADPPVPDSTDSDALPARPSAELRSLADRYAAAGQYAEAIRERLRAIVRTLVDGGVIDHVPGATITELAADVGTARPALAAPMAEAAAIFSDIWYAQQPAGPQHDARMRALADAACPQEVDR